MQLTPDQLRRAIRRNKLRSILAAATGAIAWFGALLLLAKLFGQLNPSWMFAFTATFLIGGFVAMIIPVYFLNRRHAPRCPTCHVYLSEEEIADLGECPRCHTKLFT